VINPFLDIAPTDALNELFRKVHEIPPPAKFEVIIEKYSLMPPLI
jgi:hypothetical protein